MGPTLHALSPRAHRLRVPVLALSRQRTRPPLPPLLRLHREAKKDAAACQPGCCSRTRKCAHAHTPNRRNRRRTSSTPPRLSSLSLMASRAAAAESRRCVYMCGRSSSPFHPSSPRGEEFAASALALSSRQEAQPLAVLLGRPDEALHLLAVDAKLAAERLDHCGHIKAPRLVRVSLRGVHACSSLR